MSSFLLLFFLIAMHNRTQGNQFAVCNNFHTIFYTHFKQFFFTFSLYAHKKCCEYLIKIMQIFLRNHKLSAVLPSREHCVRGRIYFSVFHVTQFDESDSTRWLAGERERERAAGVIKT